MLRIEDVILSRRVLKRIYNVAPSLTVSIFMYVRYQEVFPGVPQVIIEQTIEHEKDG